MLLSVARTLLALYLIVSGFCTAQLTDSKALVPASGSPECANLTNLYVAVNPEVIPFTFLVKNKNGETTWAGMDIEIVTELARQLGYCLTFLERPANITAQALVDDVNNVNSSANMAIGAITVTGNRLLVGHAPTVAYFWLQPAAP